MADNSDDTNPDEHTDGRTEETQAEAVAKHYNDLQEVGLLRRRDSRIFYMRNFNNWIKSVQINDIISRMREGRKGEERHGRLSLCVLDLACGKGGDQRKWRLAPVEQVVFTDIAETSIEQCKTRFQQLCQKVRRAPFEAEFIAADCSTESLSGRYSNPDQQFHMTSCQFAVHYTFESKQQAITMIRNACERLKPGGYFFGSTVNSCELVYRLLLSEDLSFGNEVYHITFKNKQPFAKFGCKYNFHLEGVVDCPEFLVDYLTFIKIAGCFGMKLVYWKTFGELFSLHYKEREPNRLLGSMFALEPYPETRSKRLVSDNSKEYEHAANFLKEQKSKDSSKLHTITLSEWEAINMYIAFAFIKEENKSKSAEEIQKILDSIPEDSIIPLRELISNRKKAEDPPTIELGVVTLPRYRDRDRSHDRYNNSKDVKRQKTFHHESGSSAD